MPDPAAVGVKYHWDIREDEHLHEAKGIASANRGAYAEELSSAVSWVTPCRFRMTYYDPAVSPVIPAAVWTAVAGGTYVSSIDTNVGPNTLNGATHAVTIAGLDAARAMRFTVYASVNHNGGALDLVSLGLVKNGAVGAPIMSCQHSIPATEAGIIKFVWIEPLVANGNVFSLACLSAGGNAVGFASFCMTGQTLFGRA